MNGGGKRVTRRAGRAVSVLQDERFQRWKTAVEWLLLVIAVATLLGSLWKSLTGSDDTWPVVVGVLSLLLLAVVLVWLRPRWIWRHIVARRIRRYLPELDAALPFGSVERGQKITLGRYATDDRLFLAPRVETERGSLPGGDADVVAAIAESVRAGHRVLLIGEAGQGKSLLLQLVHRRLLEDFLGTGRPGMIPAYVPLSRAEAHWHNDELEVGATLASSVPASVGLKASVLEDAYDDGRLALLLDGADEIPAGMRDDSTGQLLEWVESVMRTARVVSSRPAFYATYLQRTEVNDAEIRIRLQRLSYGDEIRAYLRAFAEEVGADPAAVIEIFDGSASLQELCGRPLLAFMAADVIASSLAKGRTADSSRVWTSAQIYEEYILRWLTIEGKRKDSRIRDPLDRARMVSALAWSMFVASEGLEASHAALEMSTLTVDRSELREAASAARARHTDSQWPDLPLMVEELEQRSFLVVADRTVRGQARWRTASQPPDALMVRYQFAHKSFYEYLVASHVVSAITDRCPIESGGVDHAALALAHVLPEPIVGFIREMLSEVDPGGPEGRRAAAALRRTAAIGSQVRSEPLGEQMVRQQAANLLPLVLLASEIGAFSEAAQQDSSPLVFRGAAVGLALHHEQGDLLLEFVEQLRTSPRSAEDHLAYNKIYYGDIRLDQVGEAWSRRACEFLLAASIRHLGDDRYRWIWPMDLATLQLLIEGPDHDSDAALATHEERLRQVLGRPELREVPGLEELRAVLDQQMTTVVEIEEILERVDGIAPVLDDHLDG